MSYLTADITTASDGPFEVAKLFAGGTITGVTLTPAAPATPPRIARQCIIQADPGNTTNLVYVGTDASLLPTAGGGIGNSLAAGDSLTLEDVALTGVFVSASANGVKMNIIAQGGFQ